MKPLLLAACAALALAAAAPAAFAQAPTAAPTAAEAQAFVVKAEADLDVADEFASHAAWIANTYINTDSQFLEAKASGEQAALASRLGAEAARFNGVQVDAVTRRKLNILKQGITLPAPPRPGAAAELAGIVSKMRGTYGAATFQANGKTYNLDEAEKTLRTSRDPAEIKAVWEGWHSISPPMAADYTKFVALSNEGAKALGYADTGALWRSNYDMAPDAFAAETDRVWAQLEPFYKNLHCYVRTKLNAKYGDAVQPKSGPIRADLLGNMWAQEWGNIYDIVAPPASKPAYDLNALLIAKGYDPIRMVKAGESFYSSLGYAPLPQTFWERSQIVRPRDRDVICHASAWDVDAKDDLRIKMCTTVTADDFITVHHELGHNYYQRAYNKQSNLYRNAANDGFHEAIGDFAALSAVTPTYLQQIGLLDGELPGADSDIPYLLRQAMDKIAFLPFGLLDRQMALAGVLGTGAAGRLQQGLVGAAHPVPGDRPARGATGRRLRSGGQVPHPQQHALHPLLPGPGLPVPVLSRGVQAGRLEGPAAPLLGLWRQGGRREVQRHDGDGRLQALARGHGRLHRRDPHRGQRRGRLLRAPQRLADPAEQGPAVRLDRDAALLGVARSRAA
jgi:peptidyl-dipeptidase A